MIRQPDIEGKLVVDFTIGGTGVVKTAEANLRLSQIHASTIALSVDW